jgi:predicted acetyltransferase
MLKLVKPSTKYKTSFLKAIREFHREKRNLDIKPKQSQKEFSVFIKKLRDQEKGINLLKGYVPASVYWLVDGSKFIGRVSVRHKLTKQLRKEGGHVGYEIRPSERRKGYGTKSLKLVLPKTRKLGVKKILVTCDEDNIGSRKIIESNGGVLENKIKAQSGKNKLRYWIDIKDFHNA